MATQKLIPISKQGSATQACGNNYALSTTPTAEIVIGHNQIVRIAPDTAPVGVYVRFGLAGTNSASVADHYIPSGQFETFDMGNNSSICMVSTAAGTVQVSILSRT